MTKMSEKIEFWDIYDKNKQRTGRTMKRNDWILKDDEYHLSVLGVVKRPDGRFLITQRVMTKQWAPGWWEVSGGAVMAGESSEEAVLREVREETGLDVSGAEGSFVFSYHRENPGKGDNYFEDVYCFTMDFDESDITVQKEEALGYKLATREEINALAEQGIFLHFDSIKQVFGY
jgi:8-oxo-dGTP pyrophosphatase MutT (NUDIX family)